VNRPTGNPPSIVWNYYEERGRKPTWINMAFYAFSSLSSALQRDSWAVASIDTAQMSHNSCFVSKTPTWLRRYLHFGLCLAKCKITINVIINRFKGIIHVHTDTPVETLPMRDLVGQPDRASPSINGVLSCLVLQLLPD
jgi:hypothetical protein